MKKIFAILFCVSSIMACKKSDDNTITNNSNFTANINGTSWSAGTYLASRTAGLTNITGLSSSKTHITMTLTGQSAGTYRLSQTSLNALVLIDSSTATPLNYTSNASSDTSLAGGYVYINSVDTTNKTISGTFWSKVYNLNSNTSKSITSGVFNKIPYTSSGGNTAKPDTLTLTLDGIVWNTQSTYTSNQSGYISIGGSEISTSKSIAVALPTNVTAGSYALSSFGTTYLVNYNPSSSNPYLTTAGNITVTEHNSATKRVRGTFYATTKNVNQTVTANITNGYFSFTYP